METFRIHSGVLPLCPVKEFVQDFPCPGHYKHNSSLSDQSKRTPCGRATPFCALGIFSDIQCSSEADNFEHGTVETTAHLSKLLMRISTKRVSGILQLGGLLRISTLDSKAKLSSLLSLLESIFNSVSTKMFHVMGDQESAIRTEFMQSFLAKNMKEYGLIKQPTRCCGCAYYSQRIGPEYTLIVLDGYEILSVDLSENTRYAPGGITISAPNQDSISQKCFQCRVKCGEDNLVGWATELRQENGCLDREDFKLLPRVRCAISEHQLQWLNLQLQEAVRKTDNVVVACHIPLHPLLVSDRSALPVNWKELLYLIMNFNCVRLVLSGRPLGEAAQPPNPQKPYHYDHGIVYYSVPPALELTKQDKLAWTHMIVELGYDFVRIKGEGIPLPQETPNGDPCSEPSWTIPFEPRRKLRVNHFDYAFNGGYDF